MKEQNKGKYVNLNQIYRHLREHCTKNTKKNRIYTVRELADAMTNLKDSSYYSRISQIELGHVKPSPADMKYYHKYFNVSYEYLMGETENMFFENYEPGQDLGLSDKAITTLRTWKDTLGEDSLVKILNALFESDNPTRLFKLLALCLFSEPISFLPNIKNTKIVDQNEEMMSIKEVYIKCSNDFIASLSIGDMTEVIEKELINNLRNIKKDLKNRNKIPSIADNTTWVMNISSK